MKTNYNLDNHWLNQDSLIKNGKKIKEASGFEDDPDYKEPCRDLSHNPPSHLYIPNGKRYKHVCPSCGQVTIMKGSNIIWRKF